MVPHFTSPSSSETLKQHGTQRQKMIFLHTQAIIQQTFESRIFYMEKYMSHTSLIFILVLTHSLGPLKQENYPANFLSISHRVSAGQTVGGGGKAGRGLSEDPTFSHLPDYKSVSGRRHAVRSRAVYTRGSFSQGDPPPLYPFLIHYFQYIYTEAY